LDEELIQSVPIAFLRVVYGPMTKRGTFPRAQFRDIDIERTAPRALRVNRKSGRPEPPPERQADGSYHFQIKGTGRRPFNPHRLARALYKVALGLLALNEGVEVALEARYDTARRFVLRGGTLPTHLVISTKAKPHGAVSVTTDPTAPGSPVVLDIYGFVAVFTLEGVPIVGVPSEPPEGLSIFWLGDATSNDASAIRL
jgi:hypothetical protein